MKDQFNLTSYLQERRDLLEQQLLQILPPANSQPATLHHAMHHAVHSGGKRLRPILCLAAAEAAGADWQAAIKPACAVELLHTYTLVHDDLPCMDNDLLRRGQPTVHAKFGEAIAVLTGDALLTLAFEVLSLNDHQLLVPAMVRELASATGASGVIAGQVEDISAINNPTLDTINYVFQHKTADLFRVSARLGAIVAHSSSTTLTALSTYANHLGFAFQIIDDLLDAAEATDQDEPELSCLSVMSADQARNWAKQLTTDAINAITSLPGNTTPLAELATSMLNRVI